MGGCYLLLIVIAAIIILMFGGSFIQFILLCVAMTMATFLISEVGV